MFKFMKGILVCAILGAIVFFGGQFALGVAVKSQIERVGSEMVGAPVSVGRVQFDLVKGVGTVSAFSVGNPGGYRAAEALGVDTLHFDLAPASLLSSPIRIENFRVDRARAVYEVNERGVGNLNVLLERLSAGRAPDSDSTGDADGEEAPPAESSLKIAIDQIVVADTQLTLDIEAFGGKRYEETLPAFEAEAVGGADGLPPEALGKALARVMLRNILAAAEVKYKSRIKSSLKEKLMEALEGGVGEQLEGLFNKF